MAAKKKTRRAETGGRARALARTTRRGAEHTARMYQLAARGCASVRELTELLNLYPRRGVVAGILRAEIEHRREHGTGDTGAAAATPFYLIWNPGHPAAPKVRYPSAEAAEAAATRWNQINGSEFYVLRAVARVRRAVPVPPTKVERY